MIAKHDGYGIKLQLPIVTLFTLSFEKGTWCPPKYYRSCFTVLQQGNFIIKTPQTYGSEC